MIRRRTPKQQVASHLLKLGFKLADDDIVFTQGGIHKALNDIIECWHVFCLDSDDKSVEICSAYTLTQCAKGIRLESNSKDSDLYGDLLAVPINESKHSVKQG